MLKYQLKVFMTLLFSLVVIYYYYFNFAFHLESFDGPGYIYIIFVGVIYLIYKIISLQLDKDEVTFSYFQIFMWFLAHLFILCLFFFIVNGKQASLGVALFFKVLWFCLLPVGFFVTCYALGRRVLTLSIKNYTKESSSFDFLVSLSLGLFIIILFLSIAGFLGIYTLNAFLLVFISAIVFSYKEILFGIQSLFSSKVHFENHDTQSNNFFKILQPYLLTSEFLFFIITFLISINLISVLRPFPIGWDDLGVYMNYPRLMAQSGEVIAVGQMMSWQIFTGIGYLLGSSTQAFFLNSFSGIISTLFLVTFIKHFIKKSSIINIPLTIGAIYLSLPMVIFHLAKDMKLDQGLLFVSMSTLMIVFHVYSRKESHRQEEYKYLLLAGVLAGFCFSIKLTSLLLISSLIGVIFFKHLGLAGFTGYIFTYFALFTKLQLWSLMNVVYPRDNPEFINYFSLGSLIIGGMFLLFSLKQKIDIKHFFANLGVFILGVFLALFPWIAHNYATFGPDAKVGLLQLINGNNIFYVPDYSLIHSEEYLETIVKTTKTMKSGGVSNNEDLGRYFGYEPGINNFLKLPWNLSMQVNQKGEFTDITYIFLALLPALLLFFPISRALYSIPIYGTLVLIFLLQIFKPTMILGTALLGSIHLPLGYAVILLVFGLILLYLLYAFNFHSEEKKVFQMNAVFGVFYLFLWSISAFGIVWYGIVMYVFLLILIAYGLYYITENPEEKDFNQGFKYWSGLFVFGVIIFYFFNSTITHGLINLQSAGYLSYKIGTSSEDESIFQSHPEYVPILFHLNIHEDQKNQFFAELKSKAKEVFSTLKGSTEISDVISGLQKIEELNQFLGDFAASPQIVDDTLKKKIKSIQKELYSTILSPGEKLKSDAIVYRVGTFLKYYVTENNYRLYEDSLLFNFKRYIYTETDMEPDMVVERMKKLGIKYVLIDLNAATIDDDPEKNLTSRYESLLKILVSNKVEIISNDSACLRIALEDYRLSQKTQDDMKAYLRLAGVNHETIIDGKEVNRNQKMAECFTHLYALYSENKVTDKNYTFLKPLVDKMAEEKLDNPEDLIIFLKQYITQGYKVVLKIK